ncbi:MAG: YwqG family protein [Burkholderiaceae bacterium]
MNFIDRLLGKDRSGLPPRDLADVFEPLRVPAVQVMLTTDASRSHFGGSAELPPGVAWPQIDGRPLDLLARLSLADLQAELPTEWLPKAGALLFFYDMAEQPWGFDPRDRGRFAVLLVPDMEDFVEADDDPMIDIRHHPVDFRRVELLPSLESTDVLSLNLNEEEWDRVQDFQNEPFEGKSQHQVGGPAAPIQNDEMELDCQLVTHGLYCGDSSGYHDPRAAALRRGAANWRLLLQFDSDEDLNVMWGDMGRLYFWVEADRARRGDFSNVWVIMQCS